MLRLGTRGSVLARTQSGQVAAAITAATGEPIELVEISTQGDRDLTPITELTNAGVGIFVSALRSALLAGEVDFVVHSLKDLPTAAHPEINLAAIPLREDPRDVLISAGQRLDQLPTGAKIGTGSPRRIAQLAGLGLGLELVPLRGNVDTRINKVTSGELAGVILARAGLARLGRLDEVTEAIDPLQMLPAPGQGALAIECLAKNHQLITKLAVLDDPDTRAAVVAERVLLAELEAGCTAPVGALAEVVEGETGPELWLRAVAWAADGSDFVRDSISGPVAAAANLGRQLAQRMLTAGAAELIRRTD